MFEGFAIYRKLCQIVKNFATFVTPSVDISLKNKQLRFGMLRAHDI